MLSGKNIPDTGGDQNKGPQTTPVLNVDKSTSDTPGYEPPHRGSPGGRVGGGTRGVSVRESVPARSAIVEAEGYSCMGVDKSKRDTEKEARADARRNAVENAKTYVKSQTQVTDFQLEKDFIEAYSNAAVTIVDELKSGTGWYQDAQSGECYRIRVKAEVVPDEKALTAASQKAYGADNPAAPLDVRIWTEKAEYRQEETIKVYLKGNRPFYARVLYKDASGQVLQLLPNPYRNENYFQGGIVYEIPSGNDRFHMVVTPPFGVEQVILHASTAPLGDIDLEAAGGVFSVKTRSADIGTKSRGVKLVGGSTPSKPAGAEFVEGQVEVKTMK